ncbi:MAG TPA: hypothetical protein VF627_08775 [Abditibacterium sp.]|jgi:hypothetical protein
MDSNEKNVEPISAYGCRSQQEIMRQTGRDWKDSTPAERFEALEYLRQMTWPNYSPHDPIQKIMTIGNLHDDPENLE